MLRLLKFIKNEKGQSIIEFALILPILIFLLMGIIEYGWLFNGKITLTSAAREGARVVAITKNQSKATDAVTKAIVGSGLTNINVSYSDVDTENVKVTVNAKLIPIVGFWIKNPTVDMNSVAVMRNE